MSRLGEAGNGGASPGRGGRVRAIVEPGDPPECTFYPEGVEGIDLMTRWLSAAEGSFVRLSETR